MEYITIYQFQDPIQLRLAQKILDKEGIQSVARDELSTQVLGIEARAIGGARLMVDKKDYDQASTILKNLGILNDSPTTDIFIFRWLDGFGKAFPPLAKMSKEARVWLVAAILFTLLFLIAVLWILMDA